MTKPTVITPTIGRRLWYWPSSYDRGTRLEKPSTIIEANSTQPCDAGVVCVHGDRLVNLLVTDHNGNTHKRTSVTLYQPGDTITHTDGGYAVWMDYQQAQALPKPPAHQGSTAAKYFAFGHLPGHLQAVSRPIGELAELLEQLLPNGPEKSAGMRKLLEAKDCFVRAALDVSPSELLANAPISDTDRLDVLYRGMTEKIAIDGNAISNAFDEVFVADGDLTMDQLKAVTDRIIKLEREPKQHTEDADHFEG